MKALALGFALTGIAASAAQAGPSYDCNRASTPTEYAICGSPTLSHLDVLMAAAYKLRQANLYGPARERFTYNQRVWLDIRDACGSDTSCLERVYNKRITSLRNNKF